jgi:hypothetical protein
MAKNQPKQQPAPRSLSKQPISDEPPTDIIEYWHYLSDNPAFLRVLQYCESKKGRYSEDRAESKYPHIQLERNGGNKGWNSLKNLLLNCPYSPAGESSVTEISSVEETSRSYIH